MAAQEKQVYKIRFTIDEIPQVARRVANLLASCPVKPFVVWLVGDLGAGKTTFTGHLLHALGLSEAVPVLSPTYTYLTEYDTKLGLCAHMDLYRLVDGDLDSVESLLSGRNYAGIFVEWPLRADGSPYLVKTHQISFDFADELNARVITVEASE